MELDNLLGKAATVLSRLSKKAWENRQLTAYTKVAVYKACAISTRLYGTESWTSYAVQERKQKSSTSDVYVEFWEYSGKTKSPIMRPFTESMSPSMYTLLHLRWLGHVHRMEDGRITKDM